MNRAWRPAPRSGIAKRQQRDKYENDETNETLQRNNRLAMFRKAIEERLSVLEQEAAYIASAQFAPDFRAWRRRTVADLAGLHRICGVRRCRRRGR